MFKNITYLIFGGIKWRLKGFLIGFGVGLMVSPFLPSISDLVPKTLAIAYEDQVNDGTPAGQFIIGNNYGLGTTRTFLQGVEAGQTGYLDMVDIYVDRGTGSCGVLTFTVDIYEQVATNTPGAIVGTSGSLNLCDLPTSGNEDWVTIDINGVGYDPYFITGDRFFIVINFPSANGASGVDREIQWSYTNYDYIGNAVLCTDSTFTSCTIATDPASFLFRTYVDADLDAPLGISFALAPYISNNSSTYNIAYECHQDGDIYGYDPSLGNVYLDLSESCIAGQVGTVTVPLSSEETDFWLALRDSNAQYVTPYMITVLYFPDAIVEEPDYVPVDAGICTPFLVGDEASGTYDEDIGILVSSVFYIFGRIASTPVLGDYLTLNCLVYTYFIDTLGDADFPEIQLDLDGYLGLSLPALNMDLQSAYDQLYTEAHAIDGYSTFKNIATTLLLFVILIGLWRIIDPAHHHGKDDIHKSANNKE